MSEGVEGLLIDQIKPFIHPSLGPLVVSFGNWIAHERQLSPQTLQTYVCDLKQAFRFWETHLGEPLTLDLLLNLQAQDFRAFLAFRIRQSVSKRTNARTLSAIKTFFRFVYLQKGLRNTHLSKIRAPRLSRRLPRPLTHAQAAAVTSVPPANDWEAHQDRALFVLLYGCGLRISEALNLNRKDWPSDWSPGVFLHIRGKGRKERRVPLLKEVHETVVQAHALSPFPGSPETPLFLSTRGKRLQSSNAAPRLAKLRSTLGLPPKATLHSLRHSFASHLLGNGVDLRHIQTLLGHASLQSTQVYVDVTEPQILEMYAKTHPLSVNDEKTF